MIFALGAFLAACTTDDESGGDTTAPTLNAESCPEDFTQNIGLALMSGTVTWTPPTYSDDTDAVTDLTIIVAVVVGDDEEPAFIDDADDAIDGFQYEAVLENSPITITYTAVDTSGNVNTECSFTVEVTQLPDTTAPTLTADSCPASITEGVDGIVTWTPPTYSDDTDAAADLIIVASDGTTTNIIDADADMEGFQYEFSPGITTITYTATDSSGNSTATISDDGNDCSFTIMVEPAIALTAGSCPENMFGEAGSSGTEASITWTRPTYSLVNAGTSPDELMISATASLNSAEPTNIENAGTEGTVTYTAPVGVTVVTYTATSTSADPNTECSFTITVQTELIFEFPSRDEIITATRDEGDISETNPFTCIEEDWGRSDFVCTGNPKIDFSSNVPANGGETTVYQRVEIEIIHGTYQESDDSGKVMKCDSGYVDYLEDLCPIAIIATDETQDSEDRPLRKTNSSIELMRYMPNYGVAPNTPAADRTLREDITHLWPYLQGKEIFLNMNYASSGGNAVIERVRIILTGYDTPPTPGSGESFPYKVAPAFGNGVETSMNLLPDWQLNRRQFLYQNDFNGNNGLIGGSGNNKAASSRLGLPEATVTDEDLVAMSGLDVYLYVTGRREYNLTSNSIELTFHLDKNRDLAGAVELGMRDLYEFDINDNIPDGADTNAYTRTLPADGTINIPEGRLAVDQLPGWRPGQRVPYFMYSPSSADLGTLSLQADDELFLNVTTTKTGAQSDNTYVLMLAGSYVFSRDY